MPPTTAPPRPLLLLPRLLNLATDLLTNPARTKYILPPLLALDTLLTLLIILKVPYTEIDWRAYMQQISQYRAGERDYTVIRGDTGPLVYPAAHVYLFAGLRWLIGEGGGEGMGEEGIRRAQWVFGGAYLGVVACVGGVYAGAKAPPYLLPLLILSKRLHSIFLLRLFNDSFAILFLLLAVLFFQRRLYTLGCLAYSWGLGIKMSLLLPLPAIGFVLVQNVGVKRAIRLGVIIAQLQVSEHMWRKDDDDDDDDGVAGMWMCLLMVLIALPFLSTNAKGYLSRAFELTRQFMFKWTVNWRFVGEDLFLSKEFSLYLLSMHAAYLLVFASTRWIAPSGLAFPGFIKAMLMDQPREESVRRQIARRVTPTFVLTAIASSTAIGMLCARSLHYQFYVYIAWFTPFLLWRARWHPVIIYVLWAAQEWAWNVYPSTPVSSMVVVGMLAVQVMGVWWGTRMDYLPGRGTGAQTVTEKKDSHVE
ncbi:MAG: dolichyl-P-Man:Man(5)GlcNAc(2)-PP-dolichol alpha-1,3-mannosyltransferase [Cirrosporium novae-zelandiae]|nr:MAG: dolichyl-P-Man:Man(5)GlcNAc(2)-PP-dolichol alpha-1,3-mannosyltransferase [Cirrosporium novae-zelandiae]